MLIRPQAESDYPGAVALLNRLYDDGLTVPHYAAQQAERQADPPFCVLVAVAEGRLVGRAAGGSDPSLPDGEMICSVMVSPGMEGRGIGSALFDQLLAFYREHRPARLRATVGDEQPEPLRWAEHRGFERRYHIVESRLDLTRWEPGRLSDRVAAARAGGFHVVPYGAIRTPGNDARLWQFYHALLRDTPDGAEWREPPCERWLEWALEGPTAWPDGCLLLLDPAGEWIGLTFMKRYNDQSGDAHIYLTGIAPWARGRGLSTVLKVEGACRARAAGVRGLTTINEEQNRPILAVNRRMGFARTQGYYRLVRPWPGER
ncbi:MAG: GNAT family N-acetyltransferase [Bacillota bacterium]